jgi:hypothetical protein
MGKAGLIEEGLQAGVYQATRGDFQSSVDAIKAIEHHQKTAYALLDQFINAQTTSTTHRRTFVRRVNGR